jgi:hypothetical protein
MEGGGQARPAEALRPGFQRGLFQRPGV